MKIEEKIKELKLLKQQTDENIAVIDSMSVLSGKLSARIKNKIETNKLALVDTIVDSICQSIDTNSEKLLLSLGQQTKELQDESGKEILKEMGRLLLEVEKLEQKKFFDANDLQKIVDKAIKNIVEIIKTRDEVPKSTIYGRRGDGKIIKVTEKYANSKVEYNWIYDQNGNLQSVTSKKS